MDFYTKPYKQTIQTIERQIKTEKKISSLVAATTTTAAA